MYNTQELISNNTLESTFNPNELIILRDQFVNVYSETKGWDKKDLTLEQISEIRAHKQWKNPGLIKS